MKKRSKNYRKIWEDFNGKKVPKGCHIHHLDGDRTNDDPHNLVCVTPEEHLELHKQLGHKIVNNFIITANNRKGIPRTDADKLKISKAKRGILTVPKTAELNNKVAKSMGAKPFEVYKDNTLIGIFTNLSGFCKQFKLNRLNVHSCLNNKKYYKTVSGYSFKYAGDLNGTNT